MDLNDLNKVWEIKTLKKIGEEDAKRILEKVAKQVQPIMRRRKWKVNVLSEFCPDNPALQGLNIGQGAEVKLRLRRPNREWDFFPYEQILDTMLHELCHNEHGPHNADFYKLLDDIRKAYWERYIFKKFPRQLISHNYSVPCGIPQECEELMAKGITGTGQGFDIPGRRLGGFAPQPPLSSVRQATLAAAESRARRTALLPSGPNRLGGDNNIKAALSPIQAAAMAAERRMHDDLWCGSKSMANDPKHTAGTSARPSYGPKTTVPTDSLLVETSLVRSLPKNELGNSGANWQCKTCTLLNEALAQLCEACGTLKPKEISRSKIWSCKFCTLHNSVDQDRCLACGEWRYSYGPPSTVRAPYLGT